MNLKYVGGNEMTVNGKQEIKIAYAWIISTFKLSCYEMSRNQNALASTFDMRSA